MKVSEHVWVIPDGRVNLVPNIGFIVGSKATLVVDSGMGDRNGQVVLRELQKVSKNADLYLTTTHFHPEHVTGFHIFPASAKLIRPAAQQQKRVRIVARLELEVTRDVDHSVSLAQRGAHRIPCESLVELNDAIEDAVAR